MNEKLTHIDNAFEESDSRIFIESSVKLILLNRNAHDTYVDIPAITVVMNNLGIRRINILPLKKDSDMPTVGNIDSSGAATMNILAPSKKTSKFENNRDSKENHFSLSGWTTELNIYIDMDHLGNSYNASEVLENKNKANEQILLTQILEEFNSIVSSNILKSGIEHNLQFPLDFESNINKVGSIMYFTALICLGYYYNSYVSSQNTIDVIFSLFTITLLESFKHAYGHRMDIPMSPYPILNVLLGTYRAYNLDSFRALPKEIQEQLENVEELSDDLEA